MPVQISILIFDKKRLMKYLLIFSLLICNFNLKSQIVIDSITLINPSFEDLPNISTTPFGWLDCSGREDSPADTQPGSWQVDLPAIEGDTYLGMVTRDVGTCEAVSQKLEKPFRKDSCYIFSIQLCSSKKYVSHSRKTGSVANFTNPVIFQMWGGNSKCDRKELLIKSKAVLNWEWKDYTFYFKPHSNYTYIRFEAYYPDEFDKNTNGNLMLDDASKILLIPCGN